MFSCATVFGISQALVGDDSLSRLLLGASSIIALAIVVTSRGIFDPEVLKELLPDFRVKEK